MGTTRTQVETMAASEQLTLVGVTGTNGKTTTGYFLDQFLRGAGLITGLLGTVEYRVAAQREPARLTTPPRPELQRLLGRMVRRRVTHVVAEISSHALVEGRVDGASFDLCIFTNLSHDHLRFHRTMDEYFVAKKRLFVELLASSSKRPLNAVVNIDDPYGRELVKHIPRSIEITTCSIGRGRRVAVASGNVKSGPRGFTGEFTIRGELIPFASSLVGFHNVTNALVAAAAARTLGVATEQIERTIPKLSTPPGRMERISTPWGALCLVDYAHTPKAIETVLNASRDIAAERTGRVICVVGCGGDRDRSKRSLIGSITTKLADSTYFTSDNPRSERPLSIIDEMLSGAGSERRFLVVPRRNRAILRAIAETTSNDVVVIAGRGHEYRREARRQVAFFDDRLWAQAAVQHTMLRRCRKRARFHEITVQPTSLRELARVTHGELLLRDSRRTISAITFEPRSCCSRGLLVFDPLAAIYCQKWRINSAPSRRFVAALVPRSLAYWYSEIGRIDRGPSLLIVDNLSESVAALFDFYGIHYGCKWRRETEAVSPLGR